MTNLGIVLKALGTPIRMTIIKILLKGDKCVRALAHQTGIAESTMSKHLQILKEANIVTRIRKGYYIHYQVNRDILLWLSEYFVQLAELPRDTCGCRCSKSGCKRVRRKKGINETLD